MDEYIEHAVIAESGPDNPRNDTASVVELGDGRLMVAWHKYAGGSMGGGDFGVCRIFSKISGTMFLFRAENIRALKCLRCFAPMSTR